LRRRAAPVRAVVLISAGRRAGHPPVAAASAVADPLVTEPPAACPLLITASLRRRPSRLPSAPPSRPSARPSRSSSPPIYRPPAPLRAPLFELPVTGSHCGPSSCCLLPLLGRKGSSLCSCPLRLGAAEARRPASPPVPRHRAVWCGALFCYLLLLLLVARSEIDLAHAAAGGIALFRCTCICIHANPSPISLLRNSAAVGAHLLQFIFCLCLLLSSAAALSPFFSSSVYSVHMCDVSIHISC